MERYAIYTRVSGQGQDDNFSRRIQIETCQKYGEIKGWECKGEYHDTHTGTDYKERPKVREILNLLRTGTVKHIVFPVIDRIGRDMHVIEQFVKDIYSLGGKVSIAGAGVTYETVDECIVNNFFQMAISDYEVKRTAMRTKAGRERSFLLGSYAKRPPYGYVIKESSKEYKGKKERVKELEIAELERESITTILETFANTRSKSATLKHLNTIKLAYNGLPKEHWHYSIVAKVIADASLYAGIPQTIYFHSKKYVRDNKISENPSITYTYPQIISRELAEKMRVANALNDNPAKERLADRPLAGIVKCSCGRKAIYNAHDSLELSKFMCSSGTQHKQAKSVGARQYIDNPCKHSVSPVIFIRALDSYINSLTVNAIRSRIGRMYVNQTNSLKELQTELIEIEKERKAIRELQTSITHRLITLDTVNYPLMLDALNTEYSKKNIELDVLADREIALNKQIQDITNNLINMGIDPSKLDSDYSDYDGLGEIGRKVNRLGSAMRQENWADVSYLLTELGLCMVADFGESNLTQRRESVRLVFLSDLSSELPKVSERRPRRGKPYKA